MQVTRFFFLIVMWVFFSFGPSNLIKIINKLISIEFWIFWSFDHSTSQVSPELYGDSKPRLFTYWTVRSLSLLICQLIMIIVIVAIIIIIIIHYYYLLCFSICNFFIRIKQKQKMESFLADNHVDHLHVVRDIMTSSFLDCIMKVNFIYLGFLWEYFFSSKPIDLYTRAS